MDPLSDRWTTIALKMEESAVDADEVIFPYVDDNGTRMKFVGKRGATNEPFVWTHELNPW